MASTRSTTGCWWRLRRGIRHVVLHLADHGHKALFCGDVCHHPIQVYEPDWNTRFCEIPDMARATRRRALERCAEQGALLFPTHFASPHVARITGQQGGFGVEFVPEKPGR
jgi:glyoxylase-like metal-dependent hydrolase (beta-lactamase superfamily II)